MLVFSAITTNSPIPVWELGAFENLHLISSWKCSPSLQGSCESRRHLWKQGLRSIWFRDVSKRCSCFFLAAQGRGSLFNLMEYLDNPATQQRAEFTPVNSFQSWEAWFVILTSHLLTVSLPLLKVKDAESLMLSYHSVSELRFSSCQYI